MKLENVADIYPLAPIQQGLLFHTLETSHPGAYVDRFICKLRGPLQVGAFQQAWRQAIEHYPVLRTAFLWESLDEPLQVVRQQVELPWQDDDWREISTAEQAAKLAAFLQADLAQGFVLERAPVMRLTLIRLEEETYQFIWSSHHLLFDGWSLPLIWQAVLTGYAAAGRDASPVLKSTRPYRDYIAWFQGQDLAPAQKFWTEALQGLTAPTPLPDLSPPVLRAPDFSSPDSSPDSQLPAISRNRYGQQQLSIAAEQLASLQVFAKQHQLTLNTLVQGAWALLLSRYGGGTDVMHGMVVSGRSIGLPGVGEMVGLLINSLPVRSHLSPQQLLLPWLRSLQTDLLAMLQYEATPLAKIQRWSEIPAGTALFESLVVFENYPQPALPPDINLEIQQVQYLEQSHYPLALLAIPGEGLELRLVYDAGRFEAGAMTRLLGHFRTLLIGFSQNPQAALREIPMLSEAERQQLLVDWNQTQAAPPFGAKFDCIHQLIEAQAATQPDAIAAIFEQTSLTYGELNRRANQLAHYLRGHYLLRGCNLPCGESQTIHPNQRVGICLERSLDTIVAILGVLKAGAAYVPLDPAYPQERIAYALKDTEATVLLTQQPLLADLPQTSVPTLCFDRDAATLAQEPTTNPSVAIEGDNLAYVIYTSGSTGKPKGVPISHRNLLHSTTARLQYYPDAVERFLLLSSFAFDSSVAGIFWTLCQGGTLVLPKLRLEQDLQQLAALIADRQVSHTLCLPTLYRLLVNDAPAQQLQPLQVVIVAGEACPRSLAQKHDQLLPNTILYNEYGPTEATVWCSVYQVPNCLEAERATLPRSIPMGRPIANTQLYLLDDDLQPVPIGLPGELYIGGDGLTSGYLNQPERTAERFIPNPFAKAAKSQKPEDEPQNSKYLLRRRFASKTQNSKLKTQNSSYPPVSRLYKTGDLARYRSDGNLEWLGRRDRQVKIRGYRIELGEIEEVLRQHPDIREVAVVARADTEQARAPSPSSDPDALLAQLLALDPTTAEQLLSSLEGQP